MERILRLPHNVIVKDKKSIELLLKQRESIDEERKHTPPPVVLQGIDLEKVNLTIRPRKIAGTIELEYGSKEPFKNVLYEIPDLEIDLTPEDTEYRSPERIISYNLTSGNRIITIDVSFIETEGKYWDHYGDEEAIDVLVRKNLMKALRKQNWKWDIFGGWSVSK